MNLKANLRERNTSCASLIAPTLFESTYTKLQFKKLVTARQWLLCTLFLVAILCSSGAQAAETVILPPKATRAELGNARKALQNGSVVAMLDAKPAALAAISTLQCHRAKNRGSGPFTIRFSVHTAPQTAQFTPIPVHAPPGDYPKNPLGTTISRPGRNSKATSKTLTPQMPLPGRGFPSIR